MVLIGTENKVHMKDWICQQVKEKATFVPASEDSFNHKHVIIVYRLVPQPIHVELLWQGHYLTTSHEEADVIIPQQIVGVQRLEYYSNLGRYGYLYIYYTTCITLLLS